MDSLDEALSILGLDPSLLEIILSDSEDVEIEMREELTQYIVSEILANPLSSEVIPRAFARSAPILAQRIQSFGSEADETLNRLLKPITDQYGSLIEAEIMASMGQV